MPPHIVKCTSCNSVHDGPRGRRCNQGGQSDKLDKILEKMVTIEARIVAVESGKDKTGNDHDESTESCDKDNDEEATIASLRTHTNLQKEVDARLRSLGITDTEEDHEVTCKGAQGKKSIKSGREKTASDVARISVEWPHFSVFRGPYRTPAKYDDLTPCEFVYGYINSLLETEVTEDKLQHLRDLMEDAIEHSWVAARNFHAVMLQSMEHGRLTWENTSRIQELRRVYAQKGTWNGPRQAPNRRQGLSHAGFSSPTGVKICEKYSNGLCDEAAPHDGSVHACASCFKLCGRIFNPPSKSCRRSKNLGMPLDD